MYEPSFGGESIAQVDFIGSGSSVHEPAIGSVYTVSIDYIDSTLTVYVPDVNAGSVLLSPSLIASTVIMHEPIVVDAAFTQEYETVTFELGVSRLATFTLNVSRSRSQS